MKRIGIFVLTLLLLIYPLCIYVGLNHFSLHYIALFILAISLTRFILMKKSLSTQTIRPYFFIALAGILFSSLGALFNNLLIIKLYPVMISLILLSSFYYSLLYPPTIITRIAQSLEKTPLPAVIVIYTRKVTIVWCVFFIINATFSLYTAAYSSTAAWSLYNGLLSYLFMGLLFAGEWVIRYFVKKRIVRVAP